MAGCLYIEPAYTQTHTGQSDGEGTSHPHSSQGQLLEMHLLKSQLLHTFSKNVNCSTQKVSTARQSKVCRMCTTFRFRADDKKSATTQNFEQLTKFL
jgi:hypothetical protein